MDKTLLTFVETNWFTKQVSKLLSDEEYAQMQWRLIQIPDIGDIIPGGGGIRKFRFGVKSKGKRGGARVLYYFAVSRDQMFMLDIYSKNEIYDITLPRLRELKRLVKAWSRDE